ncbi:mitochondrial enolase superfamily member 1 [Pyrgilauda ruficollis]|uniref:mitochondrial enolase superfamily member 1 n=1 Tax=Pyrgilauda ruficollis TaxID=221976 RepID=UPI001B866257|nr:mitochondrial enolase superfamily member 1 [Pyrgilauda ruficollis]
MGEIVNNFEGFSREQQATYQQQLIGPEKGTVHLAIAAVLKALWAKQEEKKYSKMVCLGKEKGVSLNTSVPDENSYFASLREWEGDCKVLKNGYLAYSGSYSWLGNSDQQLKQHAYTFKVKVSDYLQDDIYRLRSIQEMLGVLDEAEMLNAKQKWEIKEAIQWVTEPAEFKPSCIKEPTFPDEDIHIQMGHATISKLEVLRIGAATREHCHNRVIFKHLLQARALSCLQIDRCRLGSVNESLSVLLMAKKFQRKALQNSGFGGLCLLVQHLIMFDHIQVSERLENRYSCPG